MPETRKHPDLPYKQRRSAMSKLVTPIPATVELVTGIKESQYSLYRSVLFTTATGKQVWQSFPPGSPELEALTPRTRVRLIPNGQIKNGKASHVVELIQDGERMSAETKRDVASYIQEMARLYGFCYSEAQKELTDTANEETLRCAASSLFIAAQRRFQL